MRKNGFTLIELLAVIVILAIIALIATPIILGIINDAREESNERSVELYASAVRNGVVAYQLKEGKEFGTGKFSTEDLTFIEYDGAVVCETVEIYENGGVYLNNCTVNRGSKTYNYGQEQDILVNFNDVCDPVTKATTGNVPTGAYNIGDEYICEVKEGKNYTFFVLSKDGDKVNLIMESNIREDGTPVVDTTDKGLVQWLSTDHYEEAGGIANKNDGGSCQYGDICAVTTYGPITAMKHLQKATEGWNTGKLVIDTFEDSAGKEQKFKISMSSAARMPSFEEVIGTGCKGYEDGTCPLWMTNYLVENTTYYPNRTVVSGVSGYWITTSASNNQAYDVGQDGSVQPQFINDRRGLRPVITLSI